MAGKQSPIPMPGMSFPDALKAVIEGKKITKVEWGDSKIYGVLENGFLVIHREDGRAHSWIISEGDLMGNDWIVLGEEKPKGVS